MTPPEVSAGKKPRPCGFTALYQPCAARAANAVFRHRGQTAYPRSTPVRSGHSPRSLFRAAFRTRCRTHTRLGRISTDPATLMGFVGPSQFSLSAGPVSFDRSSPHAVIAIVPPRRFLRVSAANLNSFHENVPKRPTCGIIQPASGSSTAGKPSPMDLAIHPANPAMGFCFFSQVFECFFTARLALHFEAHGPQFAAACN